MSDFRLRIPDSLYGMVRERARKDNTSANQLIVTAVAEKLASLETAEYLAERAARAPSRERFLELLDRAPDVEPDPEDALED